MTATLSANIENDLAYRVRVIASKENRSVSNVVSNALIVFSEMPKELRDTMVELRAEDKRLFRDLGREMLAYLTRVRLEEAANKVAQSLNVDHIADDASDIEVLEEATRLSQGR